MTRTALALSPHLDDAAFSCGGTLHLLASRGWQVVVATLFTASVPHPSVFALACQTDKGFSPDLDYMALRREEDAAASAVLGVRPLHLPLPEAPHRGYDSAAALFGAVLPADWVAPPLEETLRYLVDRMRPDLILAPQAIGGHVDHVQLTGVFGRMPASAPILWWRDFPYAVREAAPYEPFAGALSRAPEIAVALTPEAMAAKRAACAAYASQIGHQFGGLDGLDQRLREAGAVERFLRSGSIDLGLPAAA